MTPRFARADALDLDALTALWNRAYEGYLVPLHFTPEMLSRHMSRAQVDPALSRVLQLDAEAVGVSLAALDGEVAYLAGFGVAPSHRRGGWGHRLLGEQLVALHAAGIAEVQLEVIDTNPARHLYAQAGFVEERGLLALQGRFDGLAGEPDGGALNRPSIDDLATLHASLNPQTPTWRRQWKRVEPLMEQPNVVGVAVAGAAYAVVSEGPELLGLVDGAARDLDSARRLLALLEARYPGRSWRLIDEPEGTPLCQAAREAGLQPLLRQLEMRAPLRGPGTSGARNA